MIQKLSKFLAKIFKEKLIRLEISIVKILVLYYSKTYYTEWFYNIVKFFFSEYSTNQWNGLLSQLRRISQRGKD